MLLNKQLEIIVMNTDLQDYIRYLAPSQYIRIPWLLVLCGVCINRTRHSVRFLICTFIQLKHYLLERKYFLGVFMAIPK